MEDNYRIRQMERALDAHGEFAHRCRNAKAYYRNNNDIKRTGTLPASLRGNNPLRCSDWRVSHNWHNLLVNQKASYLFSYAPVFDVGSKSMNQKITSVLGEDFNRLVKDLCIEASNCGVAWLFWWLDDREALQFAVLDSEKVVPVFTNDLQQKLEFLIRCYEDVDEEGEVVTRYEVWDEEKVECYVRRDRPGLDGSFLQLDGETYAHSFGMIPCLPFYNNREHMGDLAMYQDLIDQYDRVVSGYANDLTDIQEIIFVIRNYGGEDLGVFLSELKKYKAVKVDGDTGDGGVETMQIDIPVEARMRFLQLLKDQIFIAGHGVYPDHEMVTGTSGVALRYMYSLLEIKAGLMETEFRPAFAKLVRFLVHYLGGEQPERVQQTYMRSAIENTTELTDLCIKSEGLVSRETLLRNHPLVEDAEVEMQRLKKEEKQSQQQKEPKQVKQNDERQEEGQVWNRN